MLMETDFVLDTGGNNEVPKSTGILYSAAEIALKDDDSSSETRDKPKPQPIFRRVGSSVRYHMNDKFSKIKPGCISNDLRKALGISRHDIPLHVYRMRSLGYPPGWLRKAKVEQLPSFDEGGKLNQIRNGDSYNVDALIAFPGFNVYSSNLVDRCYEFNCPRMRSADIIENFIKSLNKSSAKTGDLSLFKQSLENKGLSDLEHERQRILSEMKALSAETSIRSDDNNPQSEYVVIDLSEDPDEPIVDVSLSSGTVEIPIESAHRNYSPKVDSSSENLTINLDSVETFVDTNSSIKVDTHEYQVVNVDPNEQVLNGTKVTSEDPSVRQIGSVSSTGISIPVANFLGDLPSANNDNAALPNNQIAAKLPSLEAFSSGIQPYVPFENLPNTQGGYNRVRNILKRIKKASGDVSISVEETNLILSKSTESERLSSQGRSSATDRSSRNEPINPRPQFINAAENRPSRRLEDKPMTAVEINDFLARSDSESSAGSDWDDVRDEEDIEEEINTAKVGDSADEPEINIEAFVPSSSQLVQRTAVKDIGVGELFETPGASATNDEDVMEYSAVNHSGLNEYGRKILDTLVRVASDRHEKHVQREVDRAILASEQPSTSGIGDDSSAAKLEALKICEEKRANALAAISGSKVTTSKGDYFMATPTNIRVMRPQISSEMWETRTTNRRVFNLVQYVREASGSNASNLQTETTVLVAVVGSKMPPRRSRNSKVFSIWRLTDLTTVGTGSSTGPSVSLFLFGACHEKLWKEPEGTVIAILKPKILPPSENGKYSEKGTVDVSITVDSAPFVMLLGMSPDFGHCAGKTKSGNPCSMIVNKNACKYCDFHVKSAYISASQNRVGFATRSISKPEIGQGRGGYMSSHRSSIPSSQPVFSLQRPLTMPASRSKDISQNAKSPRVSINISKLNSAGYKVDSSTAILATTSKIHNASTSLSKPEEVFVSSLARPSRGSLNLLRHLETAHESGSEPLGIARRSSIIPVPLLKPKSDETFATFFKGAKEKLAAEPKPKLSRILQTTGSTSESFIDLGPVSIHPKAPTSLQSLPPIRSPLDAARQRAVSLVKSRGGIEGVLQTDREKTRKRISEAVEKSIVKRARTCPLGQISGSSSVSKENLDPVSQMTPEASHKAASLDDRIKRKREELAKLLSQGSRHHDLVIANENNSTKLMLSRLEARDQIEEKLLNQHEQECQIVSCLDCQCQSMRVGKNCRKEGHKLEFSTGIRRFFACRNCKTRTVTLNRYPNFECKNCGGSLFEKAGAIAERKGPKLAGEKLVIRGIEEKFLS
nr:protein mcm10 [Hymenolepis microstoma]